MYLCSNFLLFLLLLLCINYTFFLLLLQVGLYFHFPWLLLRFFAWFEPVKSCVFCNSLCEAKCLLFLLCVEEISSCFLLLRSFHFSLPIDPWGWRGDGWWWDLMQDAVLPRLISVYCPIASLWASSYLPQAPLMRVKWYTDLYALWV